MPSESYIVKTNSHMPESYFEKATFCIKSNLKQHQKYFKTSSVNQLISILQISSHPTTTEFQSEAPHYGRTFLQESVTAFKISERKAPGSSK